MKRILFCLVLSFLAGPVTEAQLIYLANADGVSATITGYAGTGGSVIIPDTTNGLVVNAIAQGAFAYDFGVTNIVIPASVTTIGNSAFEESGLTGITIPDSVTNFGSFVFLDCHQLTAVKLGAGITNLAAGTFQYCARLAGVTVGSRVAAIGDQAFNACLSLTNIALPASVAQLGSAVFSDCYSLTNITVDAGSTNYSSVNGVLFDKTQSKLILYPAAAAGAYTIPATVTSIGDEAFDGCVGLTNVTIPVSVTNIGNYAFAASGLTAVAIPPGIASLGNEVFLGCTALASVTISNGVANLGAGAFTECTSLATVTIPASVTNLGSYAFLECTNLTGIYFLGNAPAADLTVFIGDSNAVAYYQAGTFGWSTTYAGIPTQLWVPPLPLDLNAGINLSVNSRAQIGGFGLTVSSTAQTLVEVEACTNLAKPIWTPIATLVLTNGTASFIDLQATNYPSRFYRVGSL